MKASVCVVTAIMGLLFAQSVMAQDSLATTKKRRNHTTISLGSKGLRITSVDTSLRNKNREDMEQSDTNFSTHWIMFDLGFNTVQDQSNYNSTAVKTFLNVPASSQNSSLFNLRSGKSINVNIYPFMETYSLLNRRRQQINISTGLGLQLYNFRYEAPITFTRDPNTVTMVTTTFKKDKLGFDYLTVPLMLTFKTKMFPGEYLVYGIGITGGYNLSTWTKQESGEYGKVKVHDNFDFATFNSCLTGEIGIYSGIRFYGSYQLTNLYNNTLNQHPITVGIRIFAI